MFASRLSCALRLVPRRVPPVRRSYSSHAHDHGSAHSSAPTSHSPISEENFGLGFYLLVAAAPFSAAIYKFSHTEGGEPWITKKIAEWSDNHDTWLERNTGHSIAVEDMARDRLLFFHQDRAYAYSVRNPEVLFSGSERCSSPSHIINLDKVAAHYRAQFHAKENQKAIALAKANISTETEN